MRQLGAVLTSTNEKERCDNELKKQCWNVEETFSHDWDWIWEVMKRQTLRPQEDRKHPSLMRSEVAGARCSIATAATRGNHNDLAITIGNDRPKPEGFREGGELGMG